MTWLIAYDVACPRRWRRLYRLVRESSVRLQWSVFAVTDPKFRPSAFLSAAATILDPGEDDLRLYSLSGRKARNGAALSHFVLPAGIQWRPPQ